MAFDNSTRNRLASFVKDARNLITDEFTQQFQSIYGISQKGGITALDQLGHLDDVGLGTATLLRERIDYLVKTHPDENDGTKVAVDRLAREQAFTVLNRLAAIRMAEKRDLIVESVGKGYQSKGFKVFEQVVGSGLGETYQRYRRYLFCLFDELAVDLGVLFDRSSPQALLFPREPALQELLKLLNAPDLDTLWAEDETIGWIYQYYNDPAERKKMREAGAPRNSRELAVRNQFFTPRYVVEFLTDNTLGRIWYEMTQGKTRLKDQCRYLVRRPNEIFLNPGDIAPEQPKQDNLSHQELLKQPAFIPHRPIKDPREIRMLDPACGSMHFGLYAFDLFEVIYEEAWDLGLELLRRDFPEKDALLREVPRLIIEHNIHGIDIDPRCTQIAGLSLWLRAQKSWQLQKVPTPQRPRILRSNVVCAEPMPGDKAMLRDFVQNEFSASERPAFSRLLETIFDKMQLAGEAGSLLKIEEEIRSAVEESRKLWESIQTKPRELFSTQEMNRTLRPGTQQNLGGLERAVSQVARDFWDTAEDRIYAALRDYAEQAENGGGFQRRLFAEDAARGFAFIDICSKHYDVVLMNPPFGDGSLPSKPYLDETYGDTKGDVYKAFVECFQARLGPAGYLGIISSRTGFFLSGGEDWRTRVVLRLFRPIVLADLGSGVLDAMVEVAAYVLRSLSMPESRDLTHSIVPVLEKVVRDPQDRVTLPKWQAAREGLKRHQAAAELEHLEGAGFIQRCPGDMVRYTPLWRAVKAVAAPPKPVFPPLVCVRLLAEDDKGTVLRNELALNSSKRTFVADPGGFATLPGRTFSYWVGPSVRRVFSKFAPFKDGSGRNACMTNPAGDDTRYFRSWWEVPSQSVGRQIRWVPLAKGGAFSPFYSDVHLLVDWDQPRETYRGFLGTFHRPMSKPASLDCFFRPGLTWPRRTTSGLAFRALPAGCIFADKGPVAIVPDDNSESLLTLLAVGNSKAFEGLVSLQLAAADTAARSYEVGVIQRTPVPPIDSSFANVAASLARTAWTTKRSLDSAESISHAFILPALLLLPGSKLAERAAGWSVHLRNSEETVAVIRAEIDDLAFRLYGLDAADRAALTTTLTTESNTDGPAEASDDEEEQAVSADATALVADLLAYALGSAFGRWDIRYATGEKAAPQLLDPFAPLPVSPPGQLQNAQGLPARPEDLPAGYPVRIPWDGILVDDPNNQLDIERRVREVIEIIWKDRAEAIEHEACEILGVKSLRDYFIKPNGFFGDHLKRYSKSRRQAPIYWPLATASGSYTLWIYYHRLTENTLHKALADFIDPKLKSLREEISYLRNNGNQQARLEELSDFEQELKDFRAEIERVIKLPWKPNLNDGVLVTASPLWRLFRLTKWQKDLKACWDELSKGEYDWAHLAYTIWPDRVEEACKTDRSIAIAHGLEHLCKVEAPKQKSKRKKAKDASFEDLDA